MSLHNKNLSKKLEVKTGERYRPIGPLIFLEYSSNWTKVTFKSLLVCYIQIHTSVGSCKSEHICKNKNRFIRKEKRKAENVEQRADN